MSTLAVPFSSITDPRRLDVSMDITMVAPKGHGENRENPAPSAGFPQLGAHAPRGAGACSPYARVDKGGTSVDIDLVRRLARLQSRRRQSPAHFDPVNWWTGLLLLAIALDLSRQHAPSSAGRRAATDRAVADYEMTGAPHALAAEDVARGFDADLERGLSDADAASRLVRFGPNRLPRAHRPAYPAIALRQFADPLVGLLLGAVIVSLLIGERIEATAMPPSSS